MFVLISTKNRLFMKNNLIFIENILFLMEKHGIRSERQLATLMGVNQQTINRIISGMTPDPRVSTIEEIAQFFGVEVGAMLETDLSVYDKSKNNSTISIPMLGWNDLHSWENNCLEQTKEFLLDPSDFIGSYAVMVDNTTLPWPFIVGTVLIISPKEPLKKSEYVVVHKNGLNYLKKGLINDEEIWLSDIEELFPAKPITDDFTLCGIVKKIYFPSEH